MTTSSSLTMIAAQAPDLPPEILSLVVVVVALFVIGAGQMVLFSKFYRKARPGEALVRLGYGGTRAVVGSGVWVLPIFHWAFPLPLTPLRVDLTGTKLNTEPGRSRQLPNVFQVAIGTEPEMILLAAQRLLRLQSKDIILIVEDIVLDEFERLLAQESENSSQDSPANRFIDGVEQSLNAVGLTILACRCQ